MKLSLLFLCCLSAFPIRSETRKWMGVGTPAPDSAPVPPTLSGSAPLWIPEVPAPGVDPVVPDRSAWRIPAQSRGSFLGTLEGVRCFNCIPEVVILDIVGPRDNAAATLSMRLDIWNAIERPVKDKRMFDYGDSCFSFAFKPLDTGFVGGVRREIPIRDIPCYPYFARDANASGPIARPEPSRQSAKAGEAPTVKGGE